jgi:molybdenum ABC transporter molybdate-binding protein
MRFGFRWFTLISVVIVVALGAVLHWSSSTSSEAGSNPLRIYCAAGIRLPVQELLEEYKKRYGIDFISIYDASGKLLTSIRSSESEEGLYLPAEMDYIDDARRFNLIDEVAPIAIQRPCLAIRKGSTKVARLEDLARPDVKVSLPDPKVAAISRVAQKVLSKIQQDSGTLWDSIFQNATVVRTTVNETANDIKTGDVDAGIVWDATAVQYAELEIVPVPEFEPAQQTIAISVLKGSSQPTRALHFLRFLTSRQYGLPVFERHGYQVVTGDEWSESPQLTLFTGGLMHPAIQEAVKRFERREGVRVAQVFNGCGILVAQIRGGQHPDAYFACDTSYMTRVKDLFPTAHVISGTEMVLIVSKQADLKTVKTVGDLVTADAKIGLCDPERSALGDLTKRLLESRGIWDQVSAKVMDWPSTADRLVEAVVFGALDAAVVYRANTTRQADKLDVYRIDDIGAKAIQPIAVAADTKYPLLTGRLVEQIRSAASRRQFESLGFEWLSQ